LGAGLCIFIEDGVSFLVNDFSNVASAPFHGDTATRAGALVACTVTLGNLKLVSGREMIVAGDVDLD
jgi:hypothetical protein